MPAEQRRASMQRMKQKQLPPVLAISRTPGPGGAAAVVACARIVRSAREAPCERDSRHGSRRRTCAQVIMGQR
jgi:hypothetical protein